MPGKSAKREWERFSYGSADYDYPGAALAKEWERLHRGDREPWPEAKRVAAIEKTHAAAAALLPSPLPPAEQAARLVEAWRAFHRGDFEEAYDAGRSLGVLGACVAGKAAGVYATYLEDRKGRAEAVLAQAVELTARAVAAAPSVANAHYFHAFVLGRLSQRTSIVKALAAGHATRVRQSLERTLELEPRHADAHIALGLFHAEVVAKVGALAARLTYGANAGAAVKHFKEAVRLFPDSAIGHMEYANGLLALYGETRQPEAIRLYERAAGVRPRDAMERLDVEQARAELA